MRREVADLAERDECEEREEERLPHDPPGDGACKKGANIKYLLLNHKE